MFFIQKIRKFLKLFFLLCFCFLLIACPDGGGTQPPVPPDPKIQSDIEPPLGDYVKINGVTEKTTSRDVFLSLGAKDNVGVAAYFISESSENPSASSEGWRPVKELKADFREDDIAFKISEELGNKTIYVWFKDAKGNVSDSYKQVAIILEKQIIPDDTEPPVGTSVKINGGAAVVYSREVSLSLQASDNVEITDYYAAESDVKPESEKTGWVSIPNIDNSFSFTLSEMNGTKIVYVWFKDQSGNVSNSSVYTSVHLEISGGDIEPPIANSIKINGGAQITSERDVTLSLEATDNVGITAYYLSEINSKPVHDSDGWRTPYNEDDIPFQLSDGNAQKTVYVWFKDEAMNVSEPINSLITYNDEQDKQVPVINSFQLANGSDTIGASQIGISLVATDDIGIAGYYISEDVTIPNIDTSGWHHINVNESININSTFVLSEGAGKKTVNVWVKDNSRKISEKFSASITSENNGTTSQSNDTIPPQNITLTIITDTANKTAINPRIVLSLTATDNVGVVGYYIAESSVKPSVSDSGWVSFTSSTDFSANIPFELSGGEGNKNIYIWFKDKAGLISDPAISDNINYMPSDTIKPYNQSVIINNNDPTTNSVFVSFTLKANDDKKIVSYFISENTNTPKVNDSGWKVVNDSDGDYSEIVSYKFSNNDSGVKTVYVWFRDASNNLSDMAQNSIELISGVIDDSEAPKGVSITINNGEKTTNIPGVSVSLTATDNVGVVGYYLSDINNPPTVSSKWEIGASMLNFSVGNVPFSFSQLTHETKIIYVWFIDEKGNISSEIHESIELK